MSHPKLSLCLIIKNEMGYLPDCLKSAEGLYDELVLVDSGSTDGTIAWAKDYCANQKSAHFFEQQWPDSFSAQRNFALSKASGDWILFLDADERLDEESKTEIREALEQTDLFAYEMKIRNYTYDFQEWGYQPEDPDSSTFPHGFVETSLHRLFRRDPRISYSGVLHERIEPQLAKNALPTGKLHYPIHHLGKLKERDLNLQSQRYAFYERLAVKRIMIEPHDPQAHWELGVILQKQNQLAQAEASFLKAYQLAPLSEEIEASYLMSLFQQGKFADLLAASPKSDRGQFFVCLARAQGHVQHLKKLLEFRDLVHQSSLLGLELALRFQDKSLTEEFRSIATSKFGRLGVVEFIEGRSLRLRGEYSRAVPLLKASMAAGYSWASLELFISWMKLDQPQEVIRFASQFSEAQTRAWPQDAKKILAIAQKLNEVRAP